MTEWFNMFGGYIAGYDVLVTPNDTVIVTNDQGPVAKREVKGIFKFVSKAKDYRLGWGRFPDDSECVYLYDKDDDNFGYGLNLSDEALSEWGYFYASPEALEAGKEAE